MGTKNWFTQEQIDAIVAYLHMQSRQELIYRRYQLFRDIDNRVMSKHVEMLKKIPKMEAA